MVTETGPGGNTPELQPIDDRLTVAVTVDPGVEGLGLVVTSRKTGPPPAFMTVRDGLVMLKVPPTRFPVNTAKSVKLPAMSSNASTV